MAALDAVLNGKSRSVASKTLLDMAFCHMAVFSCCDVGTIVIERSPKFTQTDACWAFKATISCASWHSSICVGKWYFSTWAPEVISWCLWLGAKCILGKFHHQIIVPESLVVEKIWHQFVCCWCFPNSCGNCLVLWRFTPPHFTPTLFILINCCKRPICNNL